MANLERLTDDHSREPAVVRRACDFPAMAGLESVAQEPYLPLQFVMIRHMPPPPTPSMVP